MSYSQARELMHSIEANDTESNFEVALEVISKYGSCRNAMMQAVKIDYKRRDELLYALLGESESQDVSPIVKELAKKMHSINRQISADAEARGEDYFKLLKAANIREAVDLSDLEVWVLNEIGGREVISRVNRFEPNNLHRILESAVKKYQNRIEHAPMNAIENLANIKRVTA